MPLGKMLAVFVAPAALVYGAYVLWPNSHCDRVAHAAVPAYWAGSLLRLGADPFLDEQSRQQALDWPYQTRDMMATVISKIFYNRDSYDALCMHDPVVAFRLAGRLDERGLIAAHPAQAAPASDNDRRQAAKAVAAHVTAAAAAAPVSRGSAAVWALGVLLLLLIGIMAAYFPATLSALWRAGAQLLVQLGSHVMVALRKLWRWHAQVLEHLLPRDVVRPSAGRDRTDRTGE
ncbi:MAG: hypothetical protein N2690_07795 [Rhodocyclaceae bacterium]|nr:hypothetical protein [Rhodocyclaceae bacterium]